MREADAKLLHEALKKRHVQAVIINELGLYAVNILTGRSFPTKYCSVISKDHRVTWGPMWEHTVRVAHDELAAPAIARTLPASCFKGRRHRRAQDETSAQPEPLETDGVR